MQVLVESPEHISSEAVAEWPLVRGKRCSWFSGALQRKIQTVLASFWQERFISLRTADAPTGRDFLLKPGFRLNSAHWAEADAFAPTDPARLDEALALAEISPEILDRELTRFSNGELRRLLLARGWMENPEVWIFDDPFGGLDVAYRQHLAGRITHLAAQGVPLVVFLRRADERLADLPAYRLRAGQLEPWVVDGELLCEVQSVAVPFLGTRYEKTCLRMPAQVGASIFELEHVQVQFDDHIVLGPLDWVVRQGEHWAILGPNGAGKSTLLGLLTADHPQIYRNRISLLGKRPGEGLNVWDHRARIGFFSPELALHYHEQLSVLETVCTGFGATLGQVQDTTSDERHRALAILASLGLDDKAQHEFGLLNNDEQRLVLIARALVRPPEVLILDEPTQGMDQRHRDRLFALLSLEAPHTTLLMVTHYPGEWPACITNVLQL